jgi:RimJ/RimL family protein N-acetyltransferase
MGWPPHGLVLTTPDLVLRGMAEADALALAAVAPADLEHDPRLPSTGEPVLQAYWGQLAHWQPDDWVLPFVVLHDGAPVGLQALEGQHFRVRRVVDSHSWLVPEARGRGLGTQMRAAVLELAFAHLGARCAVSEAFTDNHASLGVSRALGYVDNGVDVHDRGLLQRSRLAAEDWRCPFPVTVRGLEPCLPLLGLAP